MTVMTDNAAILREGYGRFAQGDVPGVLSLFAPDIRWTIPGPPALAGAYVGHAGVGEFFAKIGAAYSRLEVRPDEFIPSGDRVVVLGRLVGTGPGGDFDAGFAHAWRVVDGLATEMTEYADTEALARSLG